MLNLCNVPPVHAYFHHAREEQWGERAKIFTAGPLANLLLVGGLDAVLLEYAGEVEAEDDDVVFLKCGRLK